LPETYLILDYSQLQEEHFIESIRDYLGYIMAVSPRSTNFSFSQLAQELEKNQSTPLSFNTDD
jgi:hypothetical protein